MYIGIWILSGFVLVMVVSLLWAFTGMITNTKWKKIIIVCSLTSIGLFIFFHNRPSSNVVRMKENVIYIAPKQDTTNEKKF